MAKQNEHTMSSTEAPAAPAMIVIELPVGLVERRGLTRFEGCDEGWEDLCCDGQVDGCDEGYPDGE